MAMFTPPPFIIGFGLISGGTGSNIGDMTVNGGLAASFDGDTNQDSGAGSRASASNGYVGKNYSASPKRIEKADLYPTNNVGFGNIETSNVTLTLYGKNGGAPSNRTDGTSLGSLNIADTTSGPQTITSSDQVTAWDYVWISVSFSSATSVHMAEVEFYGA